MPVCCSTSVRPTADKRSSSGLGALLTLLAALAALAVAAAPAAAQQPVPAPPVVIDGPSPGISLPSGLAMSVARDGTGGLVYLKQVGGAQHVFVSALVGGSFRPPVEIDASLAAASSQPVIAAGNNGLLLIAFINAGHLYVVGRSSAAAALSAPGALAAGASNPSISISNFGKAYLAFTLAAGSGDDVRAAYYYKGRWALESSPLNQTPADDAGTGSGRPQVAAAGDGVAIVVWGEEGHIYARRVWATSPSVIDQEADGALPGCTESSAQDPVVGTQGDSTYADVAFEETLTCGSAQQSRVLMNRLHGAAFDGIRQPDGLAGSTADSADDPQITMGEYGHGWVISSRVSTNNVIGTALGNQGVSIGITQVNGLGDVAPTDAVPATAGLFSNLIAWQQDPGSSGPPEIRVRVAPNGNSLGPEMVLSSSGQGPTEAADGLAAAGDVAGDGVVAWLQGTAGAPEVVADQLYQPPGAPAAISSLHYARTAQPVLAWSPANEPWGPVTYTVTLDGAQIATTQATSVQVPVPLTNGPHTWQLTATNPAGEQSHSGVATVFVDTVPPIVSITLSGVRHVHSRLQLYVTYVDLPQAGLPPADASGVAKVAIRWGDRTKVPLTLPRQHRKFHSYARPGTYRLTVTASDRAGNQAHAVLVVKIVKPAPAKRHRGKPSGKHK